MLERFQQARERHPLADDALHYVALAQLSLGEWEAAIDAWEKLRREYPESEWAETAEYRVGLTMLELSDGPEYDATPILKALAREGILVSQRGSKGGYQLARPPEDLTVADMIRVLEGPVALTDCAIGPSLCEHESLCAVREPWQVISRVVERALADVTLADLVRRGAGMRTSSLASAVLQIDRTPEAGARS